MDQRTTCSPDERAQKARFESFYLRSQTPVMLSIEREVCGCDYGGSSWTNRAEAGRLAVKLGLRPGVRLLDLGAGSGWPGLYLSATSGCDVALVDLPFSGVRIARERALADGIAGRVWALVADAAALPFADGSFHAVSHSDLLCCLRPKRAVLAACRRVTRAGGRMAFTVISVAPGLSADQRRRAVANGPEFVETEADYASLLGQTGWVVTGREDGTTAYADRVRLQLNADETHREALEALIGAGEFAERAAGWRSKLTALADRVLRRELFEAAPDPGWRDPDRS